MKNGNYTKVLTMTIIHILLNSFGYILTIVDKGTVLQQVFKIPAWPMAILHNQGWKLGCVVLDGLTLRFMLSIIHCDNPMTRSIIHCENPMKENPINIPSVPPIFPTRVIPDITQYSVLTNLKGCKDLTFLVCLGESKTNSIVKVVPPFLRM